ncbi:F-box domain-containing protein [Pleurotus pulmonarius]
MILMLPPEMLEEVFENVDDKQALLNVVVASRRFFQLAEPFLYARIVFPPASLKSTTTKLRSLHEALKAPNQRRASYVRTLSLTVQGNGDRFLVDELLMKTVNLKDLQLIISPSFISRFFRQSLPFTLTSLHNASSRTVHTTSLETLHLSHINLNMAVKFSSTSFPNLKTLILDSVRIHPFVDTSSCVTHLRMTGVRNSAQVPHEDHRCLGSVLTLSCPTTHAARSMESWLPNLEWLEFSGPTSMWTLRSWHPENECQLRGIRLPQFTSGPLLDFRPVFDDILTLEFVEYGNGSSTLLRRRYRNPTVTIGALMV